MASLDHYLASRQCLWGKASSSGNDFVSVSQIFQSSCPEAGHQTFHQTMRNDDLPAWLEETAAFPSIGPDTIRKRRVLRVVWIPPHDKQSGVNDVGHGILELVTQRFNHELPQARFRATLHGAGSVLEPSTGRRSFYFCKHPHLAITWSQDPSSGLTSVICIAQKQRIDIFRDLMSCPFIQDLASLAHVPALMCSILCYMEIDDLMMNTIKQQIRRIEARTGHHLFPDRVETPATGELLLLSAAMSGCLSHLAVVTRKLGIARELEKFTLQEFERLRKEAKLDEEKALIDKFVTNVTSIQQSSVPQKIDTECLTHRAQIQQDAVKHLIASIDALATQELGKDTRSVAILTKRDSASMKALALVATFFIPPSFVSSLLSIPLFDLVSAEDKSSIQPSTPWWRRVLLYLGISGPLVILTFSIWGLLVHGRKHRHKVEQAAEDVEKQARSNGSEVMSLLARRTTETRSSWSGN